MLNYFYFILHKIRTISAVERGENNTKCSYIKSNEAALFKCSLMHSNTIIPRSYSTSNFSLQTSEIQTSELQTTIIQTSEIQTTIIQTSEVQTSIM